MLPPIADQFIAGETPEMALRDVEQLNSRGIGGIVNALGEHYMDEREVDSDIQTYKELVTEIDRLELEACLSVKPSQLGLDINRGVFAENVNRIVTHAQSYDVFVWFDMENHLTTDATLAVFEDMTAVAPGNVGVCIQANLRRTYDDLERLVALPGGIRLTKGAYAPPSGVAFTEQDTVNAAFKTHLETLFREHDARIAVATHDPVMIDAAIKYHDRFGTTFEFQMLKGVREATQTSLATEYDVWQYLPFGDQWLTYFYRRIRERKENVLFAARAILQA